MENQQQYQKNEQEENKEQTPKNQSDTQQIQQNQQSQQKQQIQQQKQSEEGTFLNWKKYLFDENLLTEVLKFEEWDRKDLNFPEANTLKKDLNRTRNEDPFFKKEKTQKKLQLIATFYCKQNYVNYQQGMLELVIPFLLLERKDFKLSKCYAYFSSFMNNFYPKFLIQKPLTLTVELPFLTLAIQFCEILLNYHCPRIYTILQECDINLSLAVTSWIVTLFAKDTKIQLVYEIFDQFIKKKQPNFVFYLIIGLIYQNQQKIYDTVEEDEDLLLQLFNKGLKNLQNKQQISEWFQLAEQIQQNTPQSFEHLLNICDFNKKSVMSQNEIQFILNFQVYNRFLPLYPQEIYINDYIQKEKKSPKKEQKKDEKSSPQKPQIKPKYDKNFSLTVIDLSKKQPKFPLKNEKISQPFNKKSNEIIIKQILENIDKQTHICLLVQNFQNQNDPDIQEAFEILKLLQNEYGRQYVSILLGGFNQYENFAQKINKDQNKYLQNLFYDTNNPLNNHDLILEQKSQINIFS
ncbi:Rab-GTPase-TBC domain [Pseudocohnilembus persalinus]|uniref:Rab-GTPase-TBC domain n=1 Tax=Pseudocohnilembus persalinus TaxID=266149 RepID=A0A0V0QHV8_PSEPJ|nr:Rab-GTPase-TBC domain [Pseudocohnilembus persalinus]|eukprot:KRX01778.1 Rab-GTPase-TBC domain [Pseudocohnilembus persalinus]